MNYVTIIGLVAGLCTTASFLPQIYQIYRTKKTRDISLPMFVVLAAGISLWLVYGIMLKQMPIIVANSVSLVSCLYVVTMKLRHG